MKSWIIRVVLIVGIVSGGLCAGWFLFPKQSSVLISPLSAILEKPLEKYTIVHLAERQFVQSKIVFGEPTSSTSAYTVYPFSFTADGKKVTGVAHMPSSVDATEQFPVIVQIRGFVDKSIYTPGVGTEHSAEVYARNGFISLAPDFLGYGGSDSPSENSIEERFQTYTTVLTLLASLGTIPAADTTRVGLWGHSNGGQIALTVLTILGDRGIPTVVWAPVTKPFPYNILYYTDEFDDLGKALRKVVADFEQEYDVNLYSMTEYLDRINAPVILHQGTADAAVPVKWSDTFVAKLTEKGKDITYYTYPGADHNLAGADAWNTAMLRDIAFFTKHLQLR